MPCCSLANHRLKRKKKQKTVVTCVCCCLPGTGSLGLQLLSPSLTRCIPDTLHAIASKRKMAQMLLRGLSGYCERADSWAWCEVASLIIWLHEIHSCVGFGKREVGFVPGQAGSTWSAAWAVGCWLGLQKWGFQGAEGGGCRDAACPSFLQGGRGKGGGWQERRAAFLRSCSYATDLFASHSVRSDTL